MSKVEYSNMVWIPKDKLSEGEQVQIRKDLTVTPKQHGDEESKPIRTYTETEEHIGIPPAYGFRVAKCYGLAVSDCTVTGRRLIFKKRPRPRDEGQGIFFSALSKKLQVRRIVLGVAQTGTGKTVAATHCMADIGQRALVIVPSKNLAHQWKREVIEHLGCRDDVVHVFEEGNCQWEGKAVVIAVIHNLCNREWPDEFYRAFGLVVWDEAHRLGARQFSQTLGMFPAKYRLALTATPTRKDGCDKMLYNAFGSLSLAVVAKSKATECTALIVPYRQTFSLPPGGNMQGRRARLLTQVSRSNERNAILAAAIVLAYNAGRVILALSDRIEQLEIMEQVLPASGIEPADIGLFVSGRTTRELEEIKVNCGVILATYGMMKEGQDIPRLDFGIDLTPRAEGIQAIGRIRRQHPDKKEPVWVSLLDEGNSMLQSTGYARIRDWRQCGVNVVNATDLGSTFTSAMRKVLA